MNTFIATTLLLFIAVQAVQAAPPADRTPPMSMDEIMQQLKDSELVYVIEPLAKHPQLKPETFVDSYWPRHSKIRDDDDKEAPAAGPAAHRALFLKGRSFLQSKQYAEAREAWIDALVLHPQDTETLEALKTNEALLKIKVFNRPFVPQALARHAGAGIEVLTPEGGKAGQSHWLAYGVLKAIWMGEPGFRKRMTHDPRHVWTATEELQSLESLLQVYEVEKSESDFKPDPEAEWLRKIFADGNGMGFVLYELGSRVDPSLMQRVSQAEREKTRAYITNYVVTRLR
ncbi:MAG: hypothetical protein HY074_13480 [Deltaproteobacteria bacterium]|nr:hypothetical protein [Deltaproteobacteria bacterium]